jgi:hypothetical protein
VPSVPPSATAKNEITTRLDATEFHVAPSRSATGDPTLCQVEDEGHPAKMLAAV